MISALKDIEITYLLNRTISETLLCENILKLFNPNLPEIGVRFAFKLLDSNLLRVSSKIKYK